MAHDVNRLYALQLEMMQRNGARWLANHPDAVVKIQFNYPPQVFLIVDIDTALDMKFVVCNNEGRELIKALNIPDQPTATVAMTRAVIESLV